MPPEKDPGLSALGKARERLYSPGEASPPVAPVFPRSTDSSIPHAWKERLQLSSFGAAHHVHFASRFFFVAIAFFVISIGVSAFLFYTGGNTVSVDNIELTIQGPTTVAGGDTVPLSIVVTNKNSTSVENATLEVAFPEGTRSATDVTAAYPRFSENLGTLSPGETVERSISAVLFGAQGAQPTISVSLSFGTSRSNAVFVKKSTYPVVISTAPLSVTVDTVSETVSGKPFTIRVTARSNATQPVEGVVLAAQYPAGYLVTDSSLPAVGTNFPLGTLKPGASKTVTLTGTLNGQNNEVRVFHFTIGTAKAASDPSLAVGYMTQEASINITAPFLTTSFTVNGSSAAAPAVAPGAPVTVGVAWANALSVPLTNAEIDIAISGAALDPASVQAHNGFYRSADRTVIFSRDTDATLASLAPGASGLGTFTFSTLTNAPRNSAITLTVSIAGERVGQSGVPEQVSASSSKVIKLVSAVTFTAASLHASGPFANSGPVPPKADQPTTYTIEWSVANAGNDLAGAVVSATLPSYIAFPGVTSPSDGSISYDAPSHAVTWQMGDIGGGASRQVAFQVVLTPSTSQRGSVPTLTSAPAFSAFDRYAQVQVTTTGSSVSTETPTDPGYTPTKAAVQ
jgi:hypothetical protein